MPQRRTERVSPAELRRIFNEGHYYERVLSGTLAAVVGYNRHPCPPQANEPYCTRSQLVHYHDLQLGRKVATDHQYLRMDGSLGASGRPDPKKIQVGDTIYAVQLPPAC